MTPFPFKPHVCKHCGAPFTPMRSMATVCSTICAIKLGKASKATAKVALKKRKEAIKSRTQWQAEAQAAVNAFVRQRDHLLPCISCGRMHEGQWHAGHYRSRGAAKHLALEPANLAKQCAPCNVHLHGNLIAYRLGAIERYGISHVEAIEADNTPRHHSIDDLKAIKADYTARTKQLKKAD